MTRRRLLAASSVATAVLATSACGNLVEDYRFVGSTGVQVDAGGHVSLVALTCTDPVERIVIVADRTGLSETEENPTLATYRARRPSTDVSLDLSDPGDAWTPGRPFALPGDRGVIVEAKTRDGETSQLNLTLARVRALTQGALYVTEDPVTNELTRQTRATFARETREACDR